MASTAVSNETVQSVERYCNVVKKNGKRCKRTAGWGTRHRGHGPCRSHGGMLTNVEKKYARAEALEFARGQLGQELDIDPFDGVLLAVRLSYGIVDFWRHRLATPDADQVKLHEGYSRALLDYSRICDMAAKAGVSERQIKIMERAAEQLSLLFEDVMAAGQPTADQRQRMIAAWVNGLAKLEQPAIDSTAVELAA